MHRELDVAAAGVHADLADVRDTDVTELLVFTVGEGHGGGGGDGVVGVNTQGGEVFDGAHDHDGVGGVAHQLQLVLRAPEDGFIPKHLGTRGQRQARSGDA